MDFRFHFCCKRKERGQQWKNDGVDVFTLQVIPEDWGRSKGAEAEEREDKKSRRKKRKERKVKRNFVGWGQRLGKEEDAEGELKPGQSSFITSPNSFNNSPVNSLKGEQGNRKVQKE